MTRDEAEKAAKEAWPKVSSLTVELTGGGGGGLSNAGNVSYNAPMNAKTFVALAVALGMLKLDEPKVPEGWSLKDAVLHCRSVYQSTAEFIDGLEKFGFKIVEK